MNGDRPQLERLEVHLGRLLLTGVTTSAMLLAIGLGMWLFDPGAPTARKRLESALGEPIAGGILVRCVADGDADQIAVERWTDAVREVRQLVS